MAYTVFDYILGGLSLVGDTVGGLLGSLAFNFDGFISAFLFAIGCNCA